MKNFFKVLSSNEHILKDTLYFDIETTGFINTSSHTYMIGMFYLQGDILKSIYLFAENSLDEAQLLLNFEEIITNFNNVCTFNGNKFDIPYLIWRYQTLNLKTTLASKNSIDMFCDFKKLKRFLPLENLKQKSFETFLGHKRKDIFNGGELISVYKQYSFTGDKRLEDIITLHNIDDIYGMTLLPNLYSYLELLNSTYKSYVINNDKLILKGQNKYTFLIDVNFKSDYYNLILKNKDIFIEIPINKTTLNYYLPNHTDYIYLTKENKIIHKSIGTYVDKAYKRKAKKNECFISKNADFIPAFDIESTKLYKNSVTSKNYYLDLTEVAAENFSIMYENIIKKLLT